jgi:sulfur-carrier protein
VATVYIPTLLQPATGGVTQLEALGASVREVVRNLELAHPGLRGKLTDGDRLRSNISVAVDGEVSPLGLLEPVGPDSEVHFVTAIQGGKAR